MCDKHRRVSQVYLEDLLQEIARRESRIAEERLRVDHGQLKLHGRVTRANTHGDHTAQKMFCSEIRLQADPR